jgi:uncharacterized protein YlxW (UPF0749 family)
VQYIPSEMDPLETTFGQKLFEAVNTNDAWKMPNQNRAQAQMFLLTLASLKQSYLNLQQHAERLEKEVESWRSR